MRRLWVWWCVVLDSGQFAKWLVVLWLLFDAIDSGARWAGWLSGPQDYLLRMFDVAILAAMTYREWPVLTRKRKAA